MDMGLAVLLAAVFAVYAYLERAEAVKQAASATAGRLATAALLNQQTTWTWPRC